MTPSAEESPLSIEQLRSWLADYGSAWEARDAAAAAALFTADASYFETPYSPPFRGQEGVRGYWAKVTADQRKVKFRSEAIGIAGGTGVAKWNAVFELASTGNRVELDGVFLLEFDDQGRCTTLREWWHAR
jgi:ketosteroid isomerase-like protein